MPTSETTTPTKTVNGVNGVTARSASSIGPALLTRQPSIPKPALKERAASTISISSTSSYTTASGTDSTSGTSTPTPSSPVPVCTNAASPMRQKSPSVDSGRHASRRVSFNKSVLVVVNPEIGHADDVIISPGDAVTEAEGEEEEDTEAKDSEETSTKENGEVDCTIFPHHHHNTSLDVNLHKGEGDALKHHIDVNDIPDEDNTTDDKPVENGATADTTDVTDVEVEDINVEVRPASGSMAPSSVIVPPAPASVPDDSDEDL